MCFVLSENAFKAVLASAAVRWGNTSNSRATMPQTCGVARLVPVPRGEAAPRRMPDVTARLQKVFGKKVISEKDMGKIMDGNRSAF